MTKISSPPVKEKLLAKYLKMQVKGQFTNNFSRNSLLMMASFVAGALITNDLSAQCGQGSAVFNPIGGAMGDGQIDLDGDGNPDFDFKIVPSYTYFVPSVGFYTAPGQLYITPVGTMGVGWNGASAANFIPSWPLPGTLSYLSSGTFGMAVDLNSTGTFYIPVEDAAGSIGFIEVFFTGDGNTIDVNPTGASGVANYAGVGPITGDCASLLAPLPVELIAFKVQEGNAALDLIWKTSAEINNQGFEIQRSIDGISFYKIGFVKAIENAGTDNNYLFSDENALPNTTYYYRLNQIDFDGQSALSEIISAKYIDENKGIIGEFTPNPASLNTTIMVNLASAATIDIQIYSNAGQLLNQINFSGNKGENRLDLDITPYATGIYFAKINTPTIQAYKKLVIE